MAGSKRPSLEFQDTSDPVQTRLAVGLHKLGLAMRQQTWLQANEQGLSPTQGQILMSISVEGVQSGSELSNRLGLSLPTISDSVRVLVEKGLVVKKPDPRHPRASLIELTAQGRASARQTRTWPEFLSAAVGTLSPEEQEGFLLGLVKMIRSLQEEGQIPTNRMCVTCVHFRPNVYNSNTPHHCAFLNSPMANKDLRLDCGEHTEADEAHRAETWKRFMRAG